MNQNYTKNIFWGMAVAAAVTLLGGCGTKNERQNEQDKPQPDSTLSSTEPIVSSNQSELLRTVLGRTGGDFRGFKFGDPLSKIKAEERFELFEDSTTHVGFTYETDNFEAIDVLYYLDKEQLLSGLRVDVYLNDANAVKGLWEQFETYLSGKYTTDKKSAKAAFWKDKNNRMVKLEDVSKGKDYGLRLSIGVKGSKLPAI